MLVERLVLVAGHTWLEYVRGRRVPFAAVPCASRQPQRDLGLRSSQGPSLGLPVRGLPGAGRSQTHGADRALHFFGGQLNEVSHPAVNECSLRFWDDLYGSGAVEADVRKQGKGVLARAAIPVRDIGANGRVVREEAHEVGAYHVLAVRHGREWHKERDRSAKIVWGIGEAEGTVLVLPDVPGETTRKRDDPQCRALSRGCRCSQSDPPAVCRVVCPACRLIHQDVGLIVAHPACICRLDLDVKACPEGAQERDDPVDAHVAQLAVFGRVHGSQGDARCRRELSAAQAPHLAQRAYECARLDA